MESRSDGPDDADDGKTVSKNKTNHRTRMQSGKNSFVQQVISTEYILPL